MSVKLRQFTTADGQTVYVNMSRKEYKAAMKAAQSGRTMEIDPKKTSVFMSKKDDVASQDKAQELLGDDANETGLKYGDGNMKTDYKALRKTYEQQLLEAYKAENEKLPEEQRVSDSQIEKLAKTEAKKLVESRKAADEVLSAEYFTPDQKEEYKAYQQKIKNAKPGDPEYGRHAVMFTEDDMKRMGQFDELSGFITTENGKRTITDQNGLKVAAAKLVGNDNKLSYEERFDRTRDAKSSESYQAQLIEKYKKDGMSEEEATQKAAAEAADHADSKMSHGSARMTKNMFKHMGFDHAHDYTEALIAGGVAAAGAGAGIGAAVVTGGAAAIGGVGAGGAWFAPAVAGTAHTLTGAAIGAGVGSGIAGASLLHKKDPVEIKIKEEEVPPEPTPTPTPIPTPTPTPIPTPTPTPVEPSHLRGRAVDEGIKARRGIKEDDWKTGTNPMQKSDSGQYVLANEDGEIEVTGTDKKKPDTITIKDNTNDRDAGNVNSYTYRKVTPEEIEAGKLDDGTPISIGNRDKNNDFYVLVSADKQDGTDIKATHAEVYEMTYEENGEGDDLTAHYDLRQYEGMSGFDVSSNDYSKRGVEGNNGASFRWGNWTRQSHPARQAKIQSYNAQSATDLVKHLQPAPNMNDLIQANPSVFDSNGNILPNADWTKLDLPQGTVFLD